MVPRNRQLKNKKFADREKSKRSRVQMRLSEFAEALCRSHYAARVEHLSRSRFLRGRSSAEVERRRAAREAANSPRATRTSSWPRS